MPRSAPLQADLNHSQAEDCSPLSFVRFPGRAINRNGNNPRKRKQKNHMTPLMFKFKKVTPLCLIVFAVCCIVVSPKVQAIDPAPDGVSVDGVFDSDEESPSIIPTPTPYDFNLDRHPDFVLGTMLGATAIWYLNNNVYLRNAQGPTLGGVYWQLAGVADFNGDGRPDYVLFIENTRQIAIWYLNDNIRVSGLYVPTLVSPGWALVAVGDFSGDGKPDCVLYNATTHQTEIWYMSNNIRRTTGPGPTLPFSWQLVGVADFDKDGHADYLLFNSSTRQTAIWYMSGRSVLRTALGPTIEIGYQLKGAADYDGDGYPDYVLFGRQTRRTAIWYLTDNVLRAMANGPTIESPWRLLQP